MKTETLVKAEPLLTVSTISEKIVKQMTQKRPMDSNKVEWVGWHEESNWIIYREDGRLFKIDGQHGVLTVHQRMQLTQLFFK